MSFVVAFMTKEETVLVDYYSVSMIGDRDQNEDFVVVSAADQRHCFVVCDGLGGHGKGDTASSLVAKYITDTFITTYEKDSFFKNAFINAEVELCKKRRR